MTITSIRKIRRVNELSQSQMAEAMGMGVSTYYQKEQGRIPWQLKDFIYIKNHYGIPIEEIDEFKEYESIILSDFPELG